MSKRRRHFPRLQTTTTGRKELFTQPYWVMKYSVFEAPCPRFLQQEPECEEERKDAHPAASVRSSSLWRCVQELGPPSARGCCCCCRLIYSCSNQRTGDSLTLLNDSLQVHSVQLLVTSLLTFVLLTVCCHSTDKPVHPFYCRGLQLHCLLLLHRQLMKCYNVVRWRKAWRSLNFSGCCFHDLKATLEFQ